VKVDIAFDLVREVFDFEALGCGVGDEADRIAEAEGRKQSSTAFGPRLRPSSTGGSSPWNLNWPACRDSSCFPACTNGPISVTEFVPSLQVVLALKVMAAIAGSFWIAPIVPTS